MIQKFTHLVSCFLLVAIVNCSSTPNQKTDVAKLNAPAWAALSTTQNNETTSVSEFKMNTLKSVCPSECTVDTTTVYSKSAAGECEVDFVLPCSPYKWHKNQKVCDSYGSSNLECATGALCNKATHTCGPATTVCASATMLADTSGFQATCSPYICALGQCRSSCTSNADCDLPNFQCKENHCIKK